MWERTPNQACVSSAISSRFLQLEAPSVNVNSTTLWLLSTLRQKASSSTASTISWHTLLTLSKMALPSLVLTSSRVRSLLMQQETSLRLMKTLLIWNVLSTFTSTSYTILLHGQVSLESLMWVLLWTKHSQAMSFHSLLTNPSWTSNALEILLIC